MADQSEQTIRPLTVGRNNWLFLGHPRAAAGRLQMYSVVSSAHRHQLMIEDYLEDVLRRLADAQQNHPADLAPDSPYLLDLLPDRWASSHLQSVCRGRIEEREAVSDNKRWRRAHARVPTRAPQAIRAPRARPAAFSASLATLPTVAVSRPCLTRALAFNLCERWRGHLWQGRFASFVMDEPYLLAAARYVELNPVRAGRCCLSLRQTE